jgi:hypothetical protein
MFSQPELRVIYSRRSAAAETQIAQLGDLRCDRTPGSEPNNLELNRL